MTSRALLEALRPFAPGFDVGSGRYTLKPDVPPELVARFRVVKTGVAAILSGRGWLGLLPDGHVVELSPDVIVPPDIAFLSLLPHGGVGWDRISSAARLDLPDLFAAPTAAAKPAKRRQHAPASSGVFS